MESVARLERVRRTDPPARTHPKTRKSHLRIILPSGPATPAHRRAPGAQPGTQSIIGATIWAKLFRARFRRLFTVPRFVFEISAISSYERPSISLRTKTTL